MDMKPLATPYLAVAYLGEGGEADKITVMSNIAITVYDLPLNEVPEYLAERIALLKMCNVNKEKIGESIGRKFNESTIYVYLSWDEHKSLTTPKSRV